MMGGLGGAGAPPKEGRRPGSSGSRTLSVALVLSGILPLLLLTASASCRAPAGPSSPGGPDIRLSEMEGYRHEGDELKAYAEAREATLSPDGSAAHLTDGAVTVAESNVRLEAPFVDVDLHASNAAGRDGASVKGPGYALEGEEFELDGESATLLVTGEVTATETSTAGTGEQAELSGEKETAPSPPPEPVNIDADQVVLHRRTNEAVFTGNVVAVRGEFRLTSRKLTVTYGEDQRITRLLAEGDVRVTEADRVVTSRKAEFDNIEEVLTLTGDAVLTEGDNVIHGDRVIFTLGTDEVRVEKVRARVRVDDAAKIGDTSE